MKRELRRTGQGKRNLFRRIDFRLRSFQFRFPAFAIHVPCLLNTFVAVRRAAFSVPLLAAIAAVALAGWPLVPVGSTTGAEPPSAAELRKEVWTVLETKCLRCHNRREKKGKLDMSTRAGLLKGGESGPALVVGDAEKSLMIELIDFDEMPPRKEKPRVTKAELDKLRAWIHSGAADRETTDADE